MKKLLLLVALVPLIVACEIPHKDDNTFLENTIFLCTVVFEDYSYYDEHYLHFYPHAIMVDSTVRKIDGVKPQEGIEYVPSEWIYSLNGSKLTLRYLSPDISYSKLATYKNGKIYLDSMIFDKLD